jgi:NAD(P)-dependent dehydrogenase (short-subunit alcohol dehydrogenase family)
MFQDVPSRLFKEERMRVVIMGGTSGIGLATATKLTAAGAEVIVTGRDPERLKAVGDRAAHAEQVDGTVEEEVAAFFERTGAIDHLVLAFSPGAVGLGPICEVSTEQLRTAFDGKVVSYVSTIRHAQVTGSITMVSAASARAAMPSTTVLAAVNGAVERMVSPLAVELAPVRVNTVSPGVIDTAWWTFLPAEQRSEQFAQFGAQLPAGRVGRADEVADAIAYLIGAEFVTSTVLPVDGGASIA